MGEMHKSIVKSMVFITKKTYEVMARGIWLETPKCEHRMRGTSKRTSKHGEIKYTTMRWVVIDTVEEQNSKSSSEIFNLNGQAYP